MQRVRRGSIILISVALVGCGQWERYEVLESSTGVYATVGVPPSRDAMSICFADRPLDICSRSQAVFVSYRSRDGNEYWDEPNVFVIHQTGGEIWKRPPTDPIRVAGQQVRIRLEYTP